MALFDEITSYDNLYQAYRKTQAGKAKYRPAALRFYMDETYNLLQLQKALQEGTYQFGEYEAFYVHEPKKRLIHAPQYHSKIVQLAINEKIRDIIYPTFISDSYACIVGKGTHRAVDRVQYFMRAAKRNFGDEAYTINLDISKFFYSINRSILKKAVRKKIKCDRTLALMELVIDSAGQISDRCLPLGNTLSQMYANICMDRLDQYAKRFIGIRYYVRYMDDVVHSRLTSKWRVNGCRRWQTS